MASIDNDAQESSELIGKTEREDGVPSEGAAGETANKGPVSLGPGSNTESNGLNRVPSSSATGVPGLSMPHPKKFSAVNINKRFLEQNAAGSGPGTPTLISTTSKAGASAPKPVADSLSLHSKLVTAKLTAAPRPSSTTGPGWSRPSSAAPSNASTSSPTTTVNPQAAPAAPSTPQLPHPGKIIHPQPRGAMPPAHAQLVRKDLASGSNKPAWSNLRPGSVPTPSQDTALNDFPTAAEVAQVRAAKMNEKKQVVAVATAQQQALQEEADAFRGVHLDPNAHHWDEMEEDDDNFLGGVIDFGDGRQYRIQPADSQSAAPMADSSESKKAEDKVSERQANLSVNKEDRFVDDFDRSWPRSRNVWIAAERERSPQSPPMRSPTESSRVLFNERSNRLEPYAASANQRNVPQGPGPHFSSRTSSHSGQGTSPTDTQPGRELQGRPQMHNVHLLQKQDSVGTSRVRGPGGPYGPGSSSVPGHDRHRDKEGPPLHGPEGSRTTYAFGSQGHAGDHRHDRAGESALSPGGRPGPFSGGHFRDAGRQLPPHLANRQEQPPAPSLRERSQEGPRTTLRKTFSDAGDRSPSGSTFAAHTVDAAPEPEPQPPPPPAPAATSEPVVIDEETRKTAMHIAAERARLRRQQEEEERERERERARRKAAELEEKMRALEASKASPAKEETPNEAQEAKAVEIIEGAIKHVFSLKPSNGIRNQTTAPSGQPSAESSVQSTSSRFGAPPAIRSPTTRRTSFPVPPSDPSAPAAAQAESWRTKVRAMAMESADVEMPKVAAPPPPSLLNPVMDSLSVRSDEILEVVDFSDHGKLIGAGQEDDSLPQPDRQDRQEARPVRPVASDFFDARPGISDEEVSWRRKASSTGAQEQAGPTDQESQTGPSSIHPRGGTHQSPREERPHMDGPGGTSATSAEASDLHAHAPPSGHSPQSVPVHGPRSPRLSSYKEAPMSALDDTILRVKGVLDNMHTHHEDLRQTAITEHDVDRSLNKTIKVNQPPVKVEAIVKSKWLPPALRPMVTEPSEPLVTIGELPRSPKPAWNAFVVRLPKQSHALPPLSKKQFHISRSSPAPLNWEVMSWNPPVEGMNRRDFSLNNVLFPKQPSYKSRFRYRVHLPQSLSSARSAPSATSPMGPKVNLPAGTTTRSGTGAFGRPRVTDDSTTWRRPAHTIDIHHLTAPFPDTNLDTTSCSPPPELPLVTAGAPLSTSNIISVSNASDLPSNRPRSQPKMPAGSAVAFYRDGRVDTGKPESKAAVNFTVTSELEDSAHSAEPETALEEPSEKEHAQRVNGSTARAVSPEHPPSSNAQKMVEGRSGDDPAAARTPMTPSSQMSNAAWTKSPLTYPIKESPSRAPDPEHLKIVWSQASDKANLPSMNSLEGIGDDLTSLPFTLPDVKSEDGETPPPSGSAAPSRMSLSDVTRAFQQVPSSSSESSPHRPNPLSPPSSNVSLPRPPSFTFGPPPPQGMRYPSYPSPMLSSPSPTIMYAPAMAPSPVPGRLPHNGPSAQYAPQPVWVPLSGPAQGPNSFARPMASPYLAPMVAYPSPGGGPSMYASPTAAAAQAHPQPPASSSQGRVNGMSAMSPVMRHAGTPNAGMPVYGSSPVLMHPGHVQMAPGHAYAPTSQGQPRSPYDHVPNVPQMQHRAPGHPQPHASVYAPLPSNSFRPAW